MRLAAGGIPVGCRRVSGKFPDGRDQYAFTVPSGAAVLHDHRTGGCTITEEFAVGYIEHAEHSGIPCGVCGDPMGE